MIKWIKSILGKLLGFAILLYCVIVGLFIFETVNEYTSPIDPVLGKEYVPPNEAEATDRLIANLKQVLEKTYEAPKRTLRDAHPKQHGLVKAEFVIPPQTDDQLNVGLFAKPGTYQAWIRFSSLVDTADTNKIAKGMGIKVMGVDGRKILPGHRDEMTHDFVFMSTPYFVSKDIEGFANLVKALTSGKGKTLRHFATHPRTFKLLRNTSAATPDLLGVEWGSTTPYLFGDKAVKYAVRARDGAQARMLKGEENKNFLRQRLSDRLAQEDVWLDLFIQIQTDPEKMPIEDPRVVWKAPLVKVASIRILQQDFDNERQDLYGDTLSFTPWHALPEHRPLGGINRGRKTIYNVMSKFRHDRNGEPVIEPSSWSDFETFTAQASAETQQLD